MTDGIKLKEKLSSCIEKMDNNFFSSEIDIYEIQKNYKVASDILSAAANIHKLIVDNLHNEFSKKWRSGFFLQSTTPKKIPQNKESYICGLQIFFGLEKFVYLKTNTLYEVYVEDELTLSIKKSPEIKGQRVQLSLSNLDDKIEDSEYISEENTPGKKSLSFITDISNRYEVDYMGYVNDQVDKNIELFKKYINIKHPKVQNLNIISDDIKEKMLEQLLLLRTEIGIKKLNQKIQQQSKGLLEMFDLQEREYLNYSLNKELVVNEIKNKKGKI